MISSEVGKILAEEVNTVLACSTTVANTEIIPALIVAIKEPQIGMTQ